MIRHLQLPRTSSVPQEAHSRTFFPPICSLPHSVKIPSVKIVRGSLFTNSIAVILCFTSGPGELAECK